MTTIDAQGNLHDGAGKFSEKTNSAPGTWLGADRPKVRVSTAVGYDLTIEEPLPYPDGVPPLKEASLGEDESGRLFLNFTFDLDGDDVDLLVWMDGDEERDSFTDEGELPFGDDASYLAIEWAHAYLARAKYPHEAVQSRASAAVSNDIIRAIGLGDAVKPDERSSYTRAADKGAAIVAAFGHADDEEETRVTDSVADLLAYAHSKGLDLDEILHRAKGYVEEDAEEHRMVTE